MEAAPPPPAAARCWSAILQNPPPPKPQEAPIVNRVFSESCRSSKGISVAVVDANAIIHGGEKLMSYADKLVSVKEVLEEVRDPVSRHRLAFMPFSVDAMEPSPDALKKVISFARATGDLQTLSDVDLKLIALTYTLEAQIHGTKHLRDNPPPLHMVNVKRLPEKEMPGWGSNVPNLAEWEALENAVEASTDFDSRILPLKDLNLNVPVNGNSGSADNPVENCCVTQAEDQQDETHSSSKPRGFIPAKKEINIAGKKMVADGIDASQGEEADNASDWLPAVSRSTHRRFLRRKARHEMSEASGKFDDAGEVANVDAETTENTEDWTEGLLNENIERAYPANDDLEAEKAKVSIVGDGEISAILKHMRLEEEKEDAAVDSYDENVVDESTMDDEDIGTEGDGAEICSKGLDESEISSQTTESVGTTLVDDSSSEQSWMLRSLSDSSVACVTSDFAMQNVILQMGLRLLAPGGMQIRQLHRWVLKCHACNKVTAEIGRIFCPKCGNGGTLRKVSVTVGENGIVLAARRPRITLRGTKFSLPLPQGGREAITKNLILREDQLPHKVLYPKLKKKSNKQDLDLLSSDDIFSNMPDKRAPLKPPIRKALAVFSGRRNPNDNHFSRHKH
ncbi:Nin one binding NOB1 Zn-ribbon-like protein [Cinnamomum micranthum f. kanehirae]|uniref:Nin one binding NOB1 Zn-ribbon-like protein n=1 Tax=Cinnamomum micranthum f. kanehirae TaxID=337451 RepID=A0A3S3M805_9MAGN|nr:Nin one binding NOB1 Zn-ribbon-like protein [Cinnamomum micranthum f. kanehirae]